MTSAAQPIATQKAPPSAKKSLVTRFAETYGVDPSKMLATLTATAFRQKQGEEITNEQMMALLVVADQYHLNPFTKEIYAFPDKGGIVPIVGVDGWSRIINEHPAFDGMEFRQSEEQVQIDEHHKPAPAWMEVIMYRKDRSHPIVVREYLDEVYRPPFVGNKGSSKEYVKSGPWQTHTKRFLRHKAMIQGARIGFGYTGIYDPDEGERIIEGEVVSDVSAQSGAADQMSKMLDQKPVGADTQAMRDLADKKPEPVEAASAKPTEDRPPIDMDFDDEGFDDEKPAF